MTNDVDVFTALPETRVAIGEMDVDCVVTTLVPSNELMLRLFFFPGGNMETILEGVAAVFSVFVVVRLVVVVRAAAAPEAAAITFCKFVCPC